MPSRSNPAERSPRSGPNASTRGLDRDAAPNAGSAQPPVLSVPKGGGAIRGIGEKFAANPVTGTASMTVPITTSAGRSGFGPQLALSYDSGAGNGPFGFGWSLSLPAITRKTDKGLPQYRDVEESDVYVLSGAEDLVPVLQPDGTRFKDDTTAPGYVIHRYRPRIEGLFARIERWTKVATGEIHWRSVTRDNVTTLYGKDNTSRIVDPAAPSPASPTRVFSWLICESYDDKGNAIVYEYAAENDDNVDRGQANEHSRVRTANRYLKRVKYGNRTPNRDATTWQATDPAQLPNETWMFEVVFDYDEAHYEEVDLDPARPEAEQHRFARASASVGRPWGVRPDPFSSRRAGFEVRTYRRCRRVLMFHHIPDLPTGDQGYDGLVRSTELDYADLDYRQPVAIEDELAHQGSTSFASFIRAVTQSGYVRDDTQAVVVRNGVQYATYLKKSLPPLEFEYSKAVIQDQVLELDAASLENLPAGLDGATYQWVDLDGEGVSGILTEQAGAWFYKPNLGDGRFGPLKTVAAKPSLASLSSGRQQLLDLASDGQLDLVALVGPTPGFYERTHDQGWEPFRAFRHLPNIPWDDPNLRFVDLDGDGHADVLISEQDVFTWHPSLAEDGFGPARQVRKPSEEERGPRLLQAIRDVRVRQVEEAKANIAALEQSRKEYYESREFTNLWEKSGLVLTAATLLHLGVKTGADAISIPLSLLPDVKSGTPTTVGITIGGSQRSASGEAHRSLLQTLADISGVGASVANTRATYVRREEEWDHQANLANIELKQIDQQLAAARIRLAIAEQELRNHDQQIDNTREVDQFLRGKFTSQDLYQWMIGQVSGLYFQSYQLAYELAKRAERCLRFELGLQDSSFISFGYWDSLKKGLLAGERLQYDLRRLEAVYLEQNRREFELTKHVSLALLDPLALVELRETGKCAFRLPEEIFDLDYPGHYFRRIKTVSLTLPCVAGPYTTISCTLRLLKNSIRINTSDGENGYHRNTDDAGLPADDPRFVENNVPVQAIATSSGQNDSGVFELAFRDDRYLPFEGAGAISEWSLELFSDSNKPDFGRPLRQFDYDSITDAVLHLRYTAREDAGAFKNAAITHLREYFGEENAPPSLLMLNLRRDFPSQWSRFLRPTAPEDGNVFELAVSRDLFPYRDADKTLKINTIYLLARCTGAGDYGVTLSPPLPAPPSPGASTLNLAKSNTYGGLHFGQIEVAAAGLEIVPTDPPATWRIKITRPGGGNLTEDPVKKVMEVEDAILVLGYEWE